MDHHRGEELSTLPDGLAQQRPSTQHVDPWDTQFINVDQELLFQLILAANYLDIRPLL